MCFQHVEVVAQSPVEWVTWKSDANYLPQSFYDITSPSSLWAFIRWIETNPITVDVDSNPRLASHEQVELVGLGIGLALRGIWVAQFPGNYSDVPDYVGNSPYEFTEYERLSRMIETLIAKYCSLYIYIHSSTILPWA